MGVKKRVLPSGRTVWRARYRGPDGRDHSREFDLKGKADDWFTNQMAAVRRGDWIDPTSAKVTFGEWCQRAGMVRNVRATTRSRDNSLMHSRVLPAWKDWPLDKITAPDVDIWIANLVAQNLAPTTVHKCFQLFRREIDAAVRRRILTTSPCADVTLPRERGKRDVEITPDDVRRLLEALPDRYRGLVLTAAYTGLRWGELVGLRVQRVNFLRRTIDVVEILTEANGILTLGAAPKTQASRARVTFPSFLADVLAEQVRNHPDPDSARGLLFTGPDGGLLRRSNFRRRVWLPAVEAAGLPSTSHFHDLRHAYSTWLIDEGANLMELQAKMRHSKVTTTYAVYGHLLPRVTDRLDVALDERFRTPSEPGAGIPRAPDEVTSEQRNVNPG